MFINEFGKLPTVYIFQKSFEEPSPYKYTQKWTKKNPIWSQGILVKKTWYDLGCPNKPEYRMKVNFPFGTVCYNMFKNGWILELPFLFQLYSLKLILKCAPSACHS